MTTYLQLLEIWKPVSQRRFHYVQDERLHLILMDVDCTDEDAGIQNTQYALWLGSGIHKHRLLHAQTLFKYKHSR